MLGGGFLFLNIFNMDKMSKVAPRLVKELCKELVFTVAMLKIELVEGKNKNDRENY